MTPNDRRNDPETDVVLPAFTSSLRIQACVIYGPVSAGGTSLLTRSIPQILGFYVVPIDLYWPVTTARNKGR